jgi:hypothetical protein
MYRFLLRLKASLGLCPAKPTIDSSWEIKEFIADTLPKVKSVVALMGVSGPAQKVIFQVWDEDKVVAYLKYAEAPAALTRVAREHHILQGLPARIGPTVLKYGPLGDGQGLLISRVAGKMLSPTLPALPGVNHFLSTLTSSGPLPLMEHPWVLESLNRYGFQIERWLAQLNYRTWPITYQHGDLAPWNLLLGTGDNIMAIDWEYGSLHGFPHIDLAQYYLQVCALIYRWSPQKALQYTSEYLCRDSPFLSRKAASALTCLAAYRAYHEAFSDGHDTTVPLQSWRRSLWNHQLDVD